jgi:hypothetical protein
MKPANCLEAVTENQTPVFPLCNGFSERFSLQQTRCGLYQMNKQTHADLCFPQNPIIDASIYFKKTVKTK